MAEKENKPRVVIITGGGTGIGRAMAETFAKNGDHVVIFGRREAVLKDAAQAIGANVSWQLADVSALEEVVAAIGAVVARYGIIDLLINNAGFNTSMSPEMTIEQAKAVWDEMLRNNLTGAFLMAYAAAPHLARPGGRIINISSDAALNGGAGFRTLGYVAAKAGLQGLTRSLAQVYSPEGITANTIAVGFVRDSEGNQRLPDDVVHGIASRLLVRRPGTAKDIAAAAFYLASEGASYITGEVLTVNGGRSSV
jgi:3-oxoacyl-[acyl-carrier protein] reductase